MSYSIALSSAFFMVFLLVGTWPAPLDDGAAAASWAGRSGSRLSPAVLDP